MKQSVIALVILIVSIGAGASDTVVGVYTTVTESEWEMELHLESSHIATVQIATWEPGQGDHASITRYAGKWRSTNGQVEAEFKKGQLTFRFEPHLSFAEFGREGSAPGLVGVAASFDSTVFVGRQLWLKSEIGKLKW